jgi:hypothetical protein
MYFLLFHRDTVVKGNAHFTGVAPEDGTGVPIRKKIKPFAPFAALRFNILSIINLQSLWLGRFNILSIFNHQFYPVKYRIAVSRRRI